ncbi:MAG: hypothetical protein Tsb0013_12510 [Phycisphaerales bacterium]
MSRFNAKALIGAASVLAMAGTAFGQLTVQEPVIDNREFVGDTTRILFDAAGVDTETITGITAQVFVVRDDGVATAVAGARAIPGTAVYPDASDFSVDGGFFAIAGANDDVIVDMGRALGSVPALRTDLDNALASIGMMPFPGVTNVNIHIQFSLTTDGPSTLTTQNPSAANPPEAATAANGGVEAGVMMVTSNAADVSPQYISAPTLSSVSISDPSGTPIANYIFNRVLNTGNATNNLNQLVVANINEDDLGVNGGAPSMGTTGVAFGPTNTVLRATYPMGTISAGNTLGFRSDIAAADNLPDARDFVGYSLVMLSGVAQNAVALAPTGAVFTAGAAAGGTATLQVIFNQALSNPGGADAYDVLLNGAALSAIAPNAAVSIGAPALDPDDPSRVNIDLDFNNVGTDDIGVASNGRAIDANPGTDFDGVGVIDHSQLPFFVQVRDDGTDPVDALGNNLDLSGTPFEDANPVGDGIEPTLLFGSSHDLDGDGFIETVALTFDETVANPGITGVTVTALDASNTTDIAMRNPLSGALPAAAAVDLMGNQAIPATYTSQLATVEVTAGTDNPSFQTNNAVIFTDLDLSVFSTMMQAPPSSGDTSNFRIDYDGMTGSITDAAGNAYSPMATTMTTVDTDRAPASILDVLFFTGDNQGANNDQFAVEQDGVVGNGTTNDRAALIFSEDLADNTPDESFITSNGVTFDTSNNNGGRLAGATADNVLTIVNNEGVDFEPGDTVAVSGGVDIDDAAGNIAQGSAVAANAVAPYIPLQNDGGVIDSAFLVDDDGDGFADRVFLQFTEDVVQADLAADGSDFQSFGANSGTITGADTLTGSDNSIVVLTVTDGEISMNDPADFRYLGTTAMNLLEGAATGNEVSAVDATFQAQEINDPDVFTNSPDVMVIVGQLLGLDGVSPAPIGTRVYASLAIPTIDSIEADHNGVAFSYRYDDRVYGSVAEDSLDAFNNVFLGLRRFLYLHREDDNTQPFLNTKVNPDTDDDGAGNLFDTIDVTLNTRNLSRITFSGQGESNQDRVSGSVTLCWRLIRGSSTVQGLYLNGFSGDGGAILLSETVISEAGGRYELHVSGIGGAFTGSPLAGLDLPVIIWCQLPTGERYALSSIYSSASTNDHDADGQVGDGVIFAPNNLQQENSGAASAATTLNFSLANVAVNNVFPGWTMLPFGSASGFANSSRDIPELPNGVAEGNIVEGAFLAASPMEQFLFFDDTDANGIWDANDGTFNNTLFIDFDCVDHLRFNLTTNGVQMGSGMTQAIGGYGIGVLNISNDTYGVFQFGAPIAAGPVFAANPISGSAANATQGWLLVTTSQEAMPASNFFTTNPGTDYVIFFDNQGADGIQVRSRSSVDSDANANNLDELPAGSAPFVHYIN